MKTKTMILHGQEVTVEVYEPIDPMPHLPARRFLDELVNATSDRVKEIQQVTDQYVEALKNYQDTSDDIIQQFLTTYKENPSLVHGIIHTEGSGEKSVKDVNKFNFRPIDELLKEVRFSNEEEEI